MNDPVNREQIIVKTSVLGILANILLAGFKALVGVFSHSIAIILDAVNNLSDALSSVITIVGTKLAKKKPDKKHPLGHGRIEYLSAMVVALIVLYAGVTSAIESVKKIIDPVNASYNTVTLIVMGVAIVVKLVLGTYVKAQGRKADSSALIASGADAFFDAVLSASVLTSAIIYIQTGVSLEAYVGLIISLVIIKSGYEMIMETISDILGRRADAKLSKRIKEIVSEEAEVQGAYDLIMNNYGPNRNYASIHIELPASMTVAELDVLTRKIEKRVFDELGVIITGVSVYSFNESDPKAIEIRKNVTKIVMDTESAMSMHGFFVDEKKKDIRFDVVFSFDGDSQHDCAEIRKKVSEMYPDYNVQVTLDLDISD